MRGVLSPDGGAGRVKTISCRFTGMVIPGSKMRVQMLGRITKGNHTDIFFEVLNSEGKRAVSNGIVSLIFMKKEGKLMSRQETKTAGSFPMDRSGG
jgi:hypothetical protein